MSRSIPPGSEWRSPTADQTAAAILRWRGCRPDRTGRCSGPRCAGGAGRSRPSSTAATATGTCSPTGSPHEGTWVFVSDPEAIKQVFTGDPRLLHAGEANIVLLPVLGEHSVLLLDEPEHMKERKLMLPPFHGKRMKAYGEAMAEIAAEEIDRWPADRPGADAAPDAGDDARDHPAGGLRRRRGGAAQLGCATSCVAPSTCSPIRGGPLFLVLLGPERLRRFPPFRRHMERVDRLLFEEIATRREVPDLAERDDILSLLLQARHEDGRPMSDRELRDELMTLLVAGHETTATGPLLGDRAARPPSRRSSSASRRAWPRARRPTWTP